MCESGRQVLGGKMRGCSDGMIFRRSECVGSGPEGVERRWETWEISFDWFGGALQAVWVVACSNDWPALLWRAVDASGRDTGPAQNADLGIVALFLAVSLSAGIVIMNSSVGVYMAAYNNSHRLASTRIIRRPRPTRKNLPLLHHVSADAGPARSLLYAMAEGPELGAVVNTSVLLSLVALATQVPQQRTSPTEL
jgi:hypothetical protein